MTATNTSNEGTFDTEASKSITLQTLVNIFGDLGASNIYIKKLAPNDNSKNQIYFGSHLTDLPFIPSGELIGSNTESMKTIDSKRKIKFQTSVNFSWLDAHSRTYPAPHTKLIYYPQYPEVRFSGFLRGSNTKASEWMDPYKQGRSLGRWLIMGTTLDEKVYGYLVSPECDLSKELEATSLIEITNVFRKFDTEQTGITDTKSALLSRLYEINKMGWIPGQKLQRGIIIPCRALNCGGLTYEAELGVEPNSKAEPDYLGWEVKTFGVKGFPKTSAKPTTLFTPQPDGGYYNIHGAEAFVREFGYPDKKGRLDRLNFGGRHVANRVCNATQLIMNVEGFDPAESKITDALGAVTLTDSLNNVVASWGFPKIMDHWKRKHSQAVYVPCLRRSAASGNEYHYGSDVELGIGTDFEMYLSALVQGMVYYDPGIKVENASTERPRVKQRSQFRINHRNIYSLYKKLEFVDIAASTL